ncbi:MAG: hypothetical protein U0325_23485 [Polyangiales bacterium]
MKRAVRSWLVVLGAVVACRRSAPATETTTQDPPAASGAVRPADCDAPRDGESLAEFDARCRNGAQAAGSDCDAPKPGETADVFQRRCVQRARRPRAARGVAPMGVRDAATPAARP